MNTLIAQLEQQAPAAEPTVYIVEEAEIELAAGEHYAGLVLDAEGNVSHHLVLLPGQADGVTWDAAKAWAASIGGELPTRQAQALLYANCKGKFEHEWYWSGEAHESDGSYAWGQYFDDGTQDYYHESYEGRARAVRRLTV